MEMSQLVSEIIPEGTKPGRSNIHLNNRQAQIFSPRILKSFSEDVQASLEGVRNHDWLNQQLLTKI